MYSPFRANRRQLHFHNKNIIQHNRFSSLTLGVPLLSSMIITNQPGAEFSLPLTTDQRMVY